MKQILVVDDDPKTRQMICDILENSDWEVDEVSSGYRAMAAVAGREYDLILLDVMMPGLNGLETIDHLMAYQAHVPIIVITAVADAIVHEEARSRGAFAVIQKPVSAAKLLSVVNEAFVHHKLSV